MTLPKVIQIVDNLHGSISISPIEYAIISSTLFNRLHGVVQNSTLYLTFPSNKTTRLIHSIGCTKIAGEIFVNGFINSSLEDQKRFLMAIHTYLNKIYPSAIRQADRKNTTKEDEIDFNNSLYSEVIPGTINTKEDKAAFIYAYQAVRLVALVHDIGHPPFSHVVEYALKEVFYRLCDLEESKKTPRMKRFLNTLESYNVRTEDLHERIGKRLTDILFRNLLRKMGSSNQDFTFFNMIRLFTVDILNVNLLKKRLMQNPNDLNLEDYDFLDCLHEIVDSDLDADNLDYVERDSVSSGLDQGSFQRDRLVKSMKLGYVTIKIPTLEGDLIEKDIPKYLPKVQSISSLERLYRNRVNLYSYVIFHHRVSKTDLLLFEIVVKLMLEYLNEIVSKKHNSEDIEYEDIFVDVFLPSDISGLWHPLSRFEVKEFDELVFSQWDDAWLLGVLRGQFVKLQQLEIKNPTKTYTGDRDYLGARLEELLANSKHYFSLSKRVDSFLVLEAAFLNRITVNNLKDYQKAFEELPNLDKKFEKILIHLDRFQQKSANPNLDISYDGLFLSKLFEFVSIVNEDINIRNKDHHSFLGEAVNKFKEKHSIKDIIYVQKTIKTKIKGTFLLYDGERTLEISNLSNLHFELELKSKMFPPFYIYMYHPQSAEFLNREELQNSFGEILAECFIENIQKTVI